MCTEEQFTNWESSDPKLIQSSEAPYYRMAYDVKMRKLFNLTRISHHNEGFQMVWGW